MVGTWIAARGNDPDLTEAETREALGRLDPLWEELFPAEQARIVRRWWNAWTSAPPVPTSDCAPQGWPASSVISARWAPMP